MALDFERLAARHRDAVYRQMYRMCGNHDDAEDVLVQSLTKAYRAVEGLQNEEAFRAWLAQIARRTCGRLKSQEKLRPVLALDPLVGTSMEPAETDSDVARRAETNELKACVLRAFEALPEIYSEVYRLRDLEGKSAEETATALGISVAAVKSRLHRARALVRERLDIDLAA